MILSLLLLGATLAAGLAGVQAGEYDAARRTFAEFVLQHPADAGVAQATLWLARLEPDPIVARDSLYLRVVTTHPQSPYADSALLEAAYIDYALGLYQNAATKMKQMLSLYPTSALIAEINYWLGVCYLILGDSTSGSVYLREAQSRGAGTIWGKLAAKEVGVITQTTDTSTTTTSDHEGYAVQVGSFTDRSRAENLLADYSSKGRSGEIKQVAIAGTTYFRVWLGPFATEPEATACAEGIKAQGNAAMVVKR